MEPARFVTYGFVYAGVLLVANAFLITLSVEFDPQAIFSLATGLIFVAGGLYRLFRPEKAERAPAAYGAFTYAFALLLVVLTVTVAAAAYVSTT